MERAPVPRPGRSRGVRVLAVGATVWLVWAVAALGSHRLPPALSPMNPVWDFSDPATPAWSSPNGRAVRGPRGLLLSPSVEAPMLSSGPLGHDPAAFRRVHLRLSVRERTTGRFGLVLRGREGTRRVVTLFEVRGGATFEDVALTLDIPDQPGFRVDEAVLVPSTIPQPAVVARISAEPGDGRLSTWAKELWSPSPGESAALAGFAMHTLPPPVLDGRSVWLFLIPIVVIAGSLARLVGDAPGPRAVIRRVAWGTVGTVWVLGAALATYHQTVALATDIDRFGGRTGDGAYALIDGVPLREDMRAVAALIPAGDAVNFMTDARLDPVVSALWKGRAGYYLAPIGVHPSGAVSVFYFGGPHQPCSAVAGDAAVLSDSERYCAWRTAR